MAKTQFSYNQFITIEKEENYNLDQLFSAIIKLYRPFHTNLKVSRSQAKIYENFANYLLNLQANNKCFILLKCTCKGLQKSKSEPEW